MLHLDLDAFFAAVEQRDKPSLRGKPVVVGGVGGRGVVATASYEARKYGVRSAMSTREARSRCPHAAFLTGRFHAYRETSEAVMGVLRAASPLVEPLSLDEAFVDLERSEELTDLSVAAVTEYGELLRARVAEVTGGLTASVGIGTSKFIAKVASDLEKPDGLVVVSPGTELELLRPMSVQIIPGVGPATTVPTSCRRNRNEVTTPKLPPPPRSAQNRSGCSSALATTRSPLASTTTIGTCGLGGAMTFGGSVAVATCTGGTEACAVAAPATATCAGTAGGFSCGAGVGGIAVDAFAGVVSA